MSDDINGAREDVVATDTPELQALDRARTALRAGDGATGEAELAEALSINPELPAALELRAIIACQKGDFDAGRQDFARITELQPDSATAWLNLGKCLRDSGDPAGATEKLEQAAALEPELADAQVLLGLALRDSGELDKALSQLETAVQSAPQNLAGVSALALQYQEMGRLDKALEQFTRARDLRQDLPHTHYNLGRALLSADRLSEAEESLHHALTINHHYHDARLALAELAEKRDDNDSAINIYRRLTRRAPRVLHAHVSLMRLLAETRRLSDMRTQLGISGELLAESDFPAFWQAQLLARSGQADQALEQLQQLAAKAEPALDRQALAAEIDQIKSSLDT
ncbi:MAG: tetratricopeptide repeat protein [Pseudomonadota bacterium]